MKTITNVYLTFAFACFALVSTTRAVNPPPDGGYPGFNTAEGQNALLSLDTSTGVANTAIGWLSLNSDVNGSFNTAIGSGTLVLNVGDPTTGNGTENTAVGAAALLFNTTGTQNTANGAFALFNNTTDSFNTATGFQALFNNTGDGGHYNVATGYQALYSNTTGRRNVADGNAALYSNILGSFNVAVGDQALYSNDSGNTEIGASTAIGFLAMVNSTTGVGDTAVGAAALINSVTGNQNIALGYCAGQDLTDGGFNIYVSNPGVASESTTIRLGNVVAWTDVFGFTHPAHTATFIAGIDGTAVVGSNVVVDANGQLGTATSSARFKRNIKPMDNVSDAILALKPVTFEYKSDAKDTPQFGLIAEEVAKVNPDLVVRDRNDEIYSVRYEAVNAMLLNEFLKEHREVAELKSTIAKQQKGMEAMSAQLKEQAAQIQKVSAQLETSKPAPQVVNNP